MTTEVTEADLPHLRRCVELATEAVEAGDFPFGSVLVARTAADLNDLSGGRLVLGVGAGWAAQEFGALGVPFRQRGKLTDDYLRAVRAAWADEGTIDQILDDLAQLRLLGADTVVLDPFGGDPDETRHPEMAWQALATVWARTRYLREQP